LPIGNEALLRVESLNAVEKAEVARYEQETISQAAATAKKSANILFVKVIKLPYALHASVASRK
jgi:hypothetical protein